MPRPRKVRRVSSIPGNICFLPAGRMDDCRKECNEDRFILKVEEYEAMRLKDIEGLSQEDAANKMKVSRQTYQRILSEGRKKVTRALMEGKAICIRGGDYTVTNLDKFCREHEKIRNPNDCVKFSKCRYKRLCCQK